MSFEALRWVRDLRAKPLQKLVLWALGDCASETGEAWPSIAALRAWTGLSERAVQRTLRELVEGGVLVVVAGGGRRRTSRYRLVVGAVMKTPSVVRGKAATPAEGRGLHPATPANVRGLRGITPPAVQGFVPETPSLMLPLPGKTPSDSRGCGAETPPHRHPEPPESNPGEGVSRGSGGGRAAARAARGRRLPADWWPDAADRTVAADLGLDVDYLAQMFRDYWHAKSGPDAVKLDWHATWRIWCRREVERGAGGARGGSAKRGRGNGLDYLRRAMFGGTEPDDAPRGPIIDVAVGE